MKISNIKIENFRSIKTANLNFNDITAIVGENNAGKTAVLRAVNAVLNFSVEKEDFFNKRHMYASRTNTYITITFIDVPIKECYSSYLENDSLTLKFSYSYGANKKTLYILKGREKIVVNDNFMEELNKDILYIYIASERTNKDIQWDERSIFKKLIQDYVAMYTKRKDTLSSKVKNVANTIHNTVFVKLEKEINNLYMQNKSVDFKIDFPEYLDYTVLLDKVQISLNETQSKYLLQDWGSGTKSLAIIAMYRADALLKEGNIILGIEEPEVNLHPQAQKRFIMSLRESLNDKEIQTIFTTHSTVMIDSLGHDDIILVRRIPDNKRDFCSKLSQISEDFWENYSLQKFKHYQYFNYKNSDFFFSKYVVLAESKIDCQVFEKLISNDLKNNIADISFLDAGGVENLKYPYFLLKELEIPFTIIVDRDFFFLYINNNELNRSRNTRTGLPMYSDVLKNDDLINEIFSDESKREKLIEMHKLGFRKFFQYISAFHILSMNYCLEMDLTCSSKAREHYYYLLRIVDKKQKSLLVNNAKAIKKVENINSVIENINIIHYPESYKKIKNYLIEDIKKTIM